MNLKPMKRVAVLTIPVAAVLATVAAPALAAVGDYTTKTYITYDITTTDKDANNGQVHVNGKIPVESTKNGKVDDPTKAPSEIGVYYKNDDFKVGVTQDVAKNQQNFYGSLYGENGEEIAANYSPATADGDPAKAGLSYTTPKAEGDATGTQRTVGVKYTGGDSGNTTVYAEQKNKDGDKLGVSYNLTNGDVTVTATDSETVGTFDNGSLKEVKEYSYVVADTNPNK